MKVAAVFTILLSTGFVQASKALLQVALKERQAITQPTLAVTLLSNSILKPVLATIVDEGIYYSDTSEARDGELCLGENIYRMDLRTGALEEQEPYAKVSCVYSLSRFNKQLLVRHSKDKGGVIYSFLKDKSLVPANSSFGSFGAKRTWRRQRLDSLKGTHWETASGRLWQVQDDEFLRNLISIKRESQNLYALESIFLRDGKLSFLELGQILRGRDIKAGQDRMVWDSGKGLYITLFDRNTEMGSVLMINLKEKEAPKQVIGLELPYTDPTIWDVLDFSNTDGWAIRNPSYSIATKYGLLVFDNTPSALEWRVISYISRLEKLAYRVQIPLEVSEQTGGMDYYRGGILLSLPQENRIVWYGRQTPFNPKIFKVRSVRPGPLTEQEAMELNERGDL